MSGRCVVFRSVLEVLLRGDLCFSAAAVPADGCCDCSVALSRLSSRKREWRSAGPRSACLKAALGCRGSFAEAGAASGRSCERPRRSWPWTLVGPAHARSAAMVSAQSFQQHSSSLVAWVPTQTQEGPSQKPGVGWMSCLLMWSGAGSIPLL